MTIMEYMNKYREKSKFKQNFILSDFGWRHMTLREKIINERSNKLLKRFEFIETNPKKAYRKANKDMRLMKRTSKINKRINKSTFLLKRLLISDWDKKEMLKQKEEKEK